MCRDLENHFLSRGTGRDSLKQPREVLLGTRQQHGTERNCGQMLSHQHACQRGEKPASLPEER